MIVAWFLNGKSARTWRRALVDRLASANARAWRGLVNQTVLRTGVVGMTDYDHPADKVFEALGSPMGWPHAHWFRCPNGHIQTVMVDQYQGEAVIPCRDCRWQGYKK